MGAIRAIKLNKLFRVYATFSVAFLLAFISSSLLTPAGTSSAVDCTNNLTPSGDICGSDTTDVNVSVTGAWTVSISSSGTLNVDVTPKGSGTTSTATDNVNIYTNTPNGYQLYLNSTSGSTDIYNNTDTQQELNHFVATTGTKDSPITLSSNSWGYSLSPNPTTFSKVETSSSAADSLITTGSKTSGSGDNLPVTYGFNADTKLTPGTYTTSVTYTAVAEVPSYNITSISPNELRINDQTDKQITIMTSTPSSELGLGDITATITNGTNTVNLTNCTEITNNNYRGAQCTYNGNLPVGTYNIQLTSSWHSATYTLTNAFTIYKTVQDITTMQEMTSDICSRMPESTATVDNRATLKDSRDQKQYKVARLADDNCWMSDNLALDGTNNAGQVRVLTPTDSNVTQSRTLAENITNGTAAEFDKVQIYSGIANDVTSSCDIANPYCIINTTTKYGNLYNWNAATAGVGLRATTTTVTESICPKSWQLPDYAGTHSLNKLLVSYNLPTDNGDDAIHKNASRTMQQPPLYFSLAGMYNGYVPIVEKQAVDAHYWTRTAQEDFIDNAISIAFNTSTNAVFHPRSNATKYHGMSVRCVFSS
ncbi:hypothetical protein IJI55_03245 [Candidatus Saccharibacteria bacterium]|nr:hypothetical protein [Candidatus Saccharibacteria bacterium]